MDVNTFNIAHCKAWPMASCNKMPVYSVKQIILPDTNSMVFIDEPEAALHPCAVATLLDIIFMLSQSGLQFFMASHSYFVVKKLLLISQKYDLPISVLSAHDDGWIVSDLHEGMPDNAIIDESIRLYKEEVELAFQ